MAKTVTAYFKLERETKNAARYFETAKANADEPADDAAKVGTLYVRKSAFGGDLPPRLVVKIEY
jgi:hypothetical protein